MNIKKIGFGSAALVLLAFGCSKTPQQVSDDSLFGTYDQGAMLNNIGNKVLLPQLNNLTASANANVTAINNFTLNPSSATLTEAQNAWKKLAEDWALVAPFGIGPMVNSLIAANVDTWPAKPLKIQTAITNQSAAATVGADAKGLKGLEYLLFDANGNSTVITKYTSASDASSRKAFVNSVATELLTQVTNLQNAWNNGYLNLFITSKGNDVSSSVSLLVNSISLSLDEIKNMKVGNPIGIGVKINDNQSHPDIIEYTIAEESLPVMKANAQAMKAAFDGGSGQGLDDLLDFVKAKKKGQNLSLIVDQQFDDLIAKINAISTPYSNSVSNNRQQVQEVFNSLKTLIAYFKVDVANNLGVTITFSDTDGD